MSSPMGRPFAADPATTTNRFDLAVALRLAAQAQFQLGNREKAIELIDRSIPLIRGLASEHAMRDTDSDLLAELESKRAVYSR